MCISGWHTNFHAHEIDKLDFPMQTLYTIDSRRKLGIR